MVGMELGMRQAEPGAPAPAPSAEEKKAQAEMDALLAKHGIKDLTSRAGEDPEAFIKRITANVTEGRALLMELMKLGEGKGAKPSPCRKGELTELKIAGETATGKYVVKDADGSTSSQEVKFDKVEGSWRLGDVVMLVASDASEPAGAGATQPVKR